MASWGEFAAASSELAARGATRFGMGIAYLATTDRDGRPHLHPVTPLIAEGRLFVFVALTTPKERNLRRDGRYAMHAVLGENDEEFMTRVGPSLRTTPSRVPPPTGRLRRSV